MFLFSGFRGRGGPFSELQGRGGVRFLDFRGGVGVRFLGFRGGMGDLPATSGGWPGAGGMGWPVAGGMHRGVLHYPLFKDIE